jgi:hypothetical protein
LPLDIPFDQRGPYDSSTESAHAQSVRTEHITDASLLLLVFYHPFYDYMGDKMSRSLSTDYHHHATLDERDRWLIDWC